MLNQASVQKKGSVVLALNLITTCTIILHSDKIDHPTSLLQQSIMIDLFKPLEVLALNNVELTGKELGC